MSTTIQLTKAGEKMLREELEHLKTVTRPEVAAKIKVALSFGDLSENSEYDDAKDEQATNENRISGRFMPNVIYRALPAALSDLILVVGVMLFYLAFHIKEDMLSTLCTGIMGIVGLLMVHQTSLPMNKLRKAMLVGLCIAFVVCYFFLPELFTLSALDKPSLLILVVLGLLAFSVMFVCRRGLRKAKARLDKGIFPHRKKR